MSQSNQEKTQERAQPARAERKPDASTPLPEEPHQPPHIEGIGPEGVPVTTTGKTP